MGGWICCYWIALLAGMKRWWRKGEREKLEGWDNEKEQGLRRELGGQRWEQDSEERPEENPGDVIDPTIVPGKPGRKLAQPKR